MRGKGGFARKAVSVGAAEKFAGLGSPYLPRVIIKAHVPDHGSDSEPCDDTYGGWVIDTFSPDVWRHILLMSVHEADNEG